MIGPIKALIALPFVLAWRVLSFVFSLPLQVPAINRLFERLTTRFFRTDTPTAALDRMAKHSLAVSRATGNWFERFDQGELDETKALLIEDKLLQYAHLVLPPVPKKPGGVSYGFCYEKGIPQDMERDVLIEGRALNGESPSDAFAARCLTDEFISDAWVKSARNAGITAITTLLIVLSIAGFYVSAQISDAFEKSGASDVSTLQYKLNPMDVSQQYRDVWSQKDIDELSNALSSADRAKATARAVSASATSISKAILVSVIAFISGLALAWIAGNWAFVACFRGMVGEAVARSIEPLSHTRLQATVGFQHNFAAIIEYLKTYEKAVKTALKRDNSPFIIFGRSIGVFAMRAHLLAPRVGALLGLTILGLTTHLLIRGSSGSGKSRTFLKPFIKQLLRLRKGTPGKPGMPIAAYITDAKGKFGEEVRAIAEEVGIPKEDIIVIGTKDDEYFVDAMEYLTPAEFAQVLKSIESQSGGGGSSDPFWANSASTVGFMVGTLLFAAERTSIGIRWCEQNASRLYCPAMINTVAQSKELTLTWCEVVVDALHDNYVAIGDLDNGALRNSIEMLVTKFVPLPDGQREGILSNLDEMLNGFSRDEALSSFARGYSRTKPQLPVDQLIGNTVKFVNIRGGTKASKVISIMLKSLLYKLAKERDSRDKSLEERRDAWWNKPRFDCDVSQFAITFFIADEFQDLITSSDDDLSDAKFWNIARSTGIAGIFATQTRAALVLNIGQDATENWLNQISSFVVLRNKNDDDIEEIQDLMGKSVRYHGRDSDKSENTVTLDVERGINIDSLEVAKLPKDYSLNSFSDITPPEYADLVELDTRWIPGEMSGRDRFDYKKDAVHRKEDKEQNLYQTGHTLSNVFEKEDMSLLGNGFAVVHLNRSGLVINEIVDLEDWSLEDCK